MQKRFALVALVGMMIGCGDSRSVTGPSESTQTTPAVTASPTPPPSPPPATPTSTVVGSITGNSWEVTNTGEIGAIYWARLYEIVGAGEQQLRYEFQSGTVPPGEKWGGSFPTLPCNYQIDIDGDYPIKHPAPGKIASVIVAGNVCPTPTPTPEPPCVGDCDPPKCVDEVLTTVKSGAYCLDHPLGSKAKEAAWLGVPNVGVKTDGVDKECVKLDKHDIILFKDGSCGGGDGQRYFVATGGGKFCPFPKGGRYKDISHYTVFDGKKCPR